MTRPAGRPPDSSVPGTRSGWWSGWSGPSVIYRAWPLAASRAGDGLTDTSPAGMAAQIEQAGRAAATRRRPRRALAVGT